MDFLISAAGGLVASLVVFVAASRHAGERGFSLPAAPVLVGFFCGVLGHHLSPWAALAVVALYAAMAFREAHVMRQALTRAGPTDRSAG